MHWSCIDEIVIGFKPVEEFYPSPPLGVDSADTSQLPKEKNLHGQFQYFQITQYRYSSLPIEAAEILMLCKQLINKVNEGNKLQPWHYPTRYSNGHPFLYKQNLRLCTPKPFESIFFFFLLLSNFIIIILKNRKRTKQIDSRDSHVKHATETHRVSKNFFR
jgi:hypothetical protein